jgi:hypothetical protein
MSLIISFTTREGIVMAADSRLTLTFPDPDFADPNNPDAKHFISVPQTDATRKLFLAQDRIGISVCGNATIGNVPISGFIESFIRTLTPSFSVEEAAEGVLRHFASIDPSLATWFHVAGYSDSGIEKLTEVWFVSIATNQKNLTIGRGQQDGRWNGELDLLNRLFWQVYLKDANGNYQPLPHPGIALPFLTLQDAVDLAVFAMRTTIDLMGFQSRLRTVGGPIDVPVIKPDRAQWLSQKQLHVTGSVSLPGPTSVPQEIQNFPILTESAPKQESPRE